MAIEGNGIGTRHNWVEKVYGGDDFEKAGMFTNRNLCSLRGRVTSYVLGRAANCSAAGGDAWPVDLLKCTSTR